MTMPWTQAAPELPPLPKELVDGIRKMRVVIATPTRSRFVGDNYRRAVDELRVRLGDQVDPLSTLPAIRDENHGELVLPELLDDAASGFTGTLSDQFDLTRTRSRFVRLFLERTNAPWLLWWDDDVWCRRPHVALAGMMTAALVADVHVVGALYPGKHRNKRRLVEAARAGKPNPLRHAFTIQDMRIWKRAEDRRPAPHPHLLPVNGVGFGFCLVSRIALERVYEASDKPFRDRILGGYTKNVHFGINDGEEDYSEDYCFCIRAEAAGFDVQAYLGPESPMIHDGMESFEADPACLLALPSEEELRREP